MSAYYDREDIMEAWYLHLVCHNDGKGCENYRRLCRLTCHFRPPPWLSNEDGLSENGRAIYDNLHKGTD